MTSHRLMQIAFIIVSVCGCASDQKGSDVSKVRTMKYSAAALMTLPENEDNHTMPSGASVYPRMVIKTAHLQIVVPKYEESLTRIRNIVAQNNGFIVHSTKNSVENGDASGDAALRIPSIHFDNTLKQIKGVAQKIERETIEGNDVTETFYDITARLENNRKVEARYNEIIKVATKVKEILEIEKAIANVREEIERLTARKQFLADQTALSTMYLKIYEPMPPVILADEGLWFKVTEGYRDGLDGFGVFLRHTITVIVAAGPFLLVLGSILGGLIQINKRSQQKLNEHSK